MIELPGSCFVVTEYVLWNIPLFFLLKIYLIVKNRDGCIVIGVKTENVVQRNLNVDLTMILVIIFLCSRS